MSDRFDMLRQMRNKNNNLATDDIELNELKLSENIQEPKSFKLELDIFKIDGVLNRKYYFFTLMAINSLSIASCIIVAFLFKNEVISSLYTLAFLMFWLYLYYIATYKRVTDLMASNYKIKIKTLFYCLPLISLIPLFVKGQITDELHKNKDTSMQKYIWELDGYINFTDLTKSLLLLFIITIFLITMLIFGLKDKYVKTIIEMRDILTIFMPVIIMLAFNIEKYISFKKRDEIKFVCANCGHKNNKCNFCVKCGGVLSNEMS